MRGLIQASLGNPYAVIVGTLTVIMLGVMAVTSVPIDILPVFKSPAVQVLTFYGGMPAVGMEKDITVRMERWTGQATGVKKQESRSIQGASIVRNYFFEDQDPSGALTQINSLALAIIPNLPPGTLPPVVLPFDPTSSTPIALVALNSKTQTEAILYDVGRYQVRNFIMQNKGANAPVVIGGKMRAVMLYLDPEKMQARGMSPPDVMNAVSRFNLFFPSGDVKIGTRDYALSSNSMFDAVERMEEIPISSKLGNPVFLREVAKAKDSAFIQTNIVRVDGRKQVYIPIYRQIGASTLTVVDTLRDTLPDMKARIKEPDIDLQLVMDQSVYVRASISALMQEGAIGAVLCSLVILLFLGQWRMTLIAIVTLPISVLAAIIGLLYVGQTINVMTLAGLTLAIGPMIDSAIICLENTHRHLSMGATPHRAALDGASEVAMPELVSTLCTFLVLSPLALMPGMGKFLFLPMALAVMFAMTTAYILSRTLVPCASAFLLRHHEMDIEETRGPIGRAFGHVEWFIDQGIALYVRGLDVCLRFRVTTVVIAFTMLAVTLVAMVPIMRRDFFPEVDAGAFEIAARAPSGTRIELTEEMVAKVENFIRETIPEEDLELIVSEIGLTADWSAAYTPNAGPMDSVVKVQLTPERSRSAQHYVRALRTGFAKDPNLSELEFSFDAGGMIRGALNEGKSSPITIQLVGKDQEVLFGMADQIKAVVHKIEGIADERILQRPDAPELMINVNRAKAAEIGLNQDDIMKSVIAATNSSITYNKRNFWIDPVSGNQYFVGVQYPEVKFQTESDILNVPITSPMQKKPIVLDNVAHFTKNLIPTEVHHVNLQSTIDLTMNVEGRDLGHVSDDVARALAPFGKDRRDGTWAPYDPRFGAHTKFRVVNQNGTSVAQWTENDSPIEAEVTTDEKGKRHAKYRKPTKTEGKTEGRTYGNDQSKDEDNTIEIVTDHTGKDQVIMTGSNITLAGEYTRMQDTFNNLGTGLILACLLIYFLMVALDRSFVVPMAVMLIVPLCLIGILPMLFITGSAVNVQSLLGFIFTVGIKVANTVLMTDYAQELRRHEGLTPVAAIRKAASLRVRPVTMTALAAFFAMIPTALALEHGSEANAPLARAILGGLLAGEPATLFVLPALYAIMVRGSLKPAHDPSQDQDPHGPAAPEAAH